MIFRRIADFLFAPVTRRLRAYVHTLYEIRDAVAALRSETETRFHLLDRTLHNLHQTTALGVRRIPVPEGRPVRVLFLIHARELWADYAGVYDAMVKAGDFEPTVATIERIGENNVNLGEDQAHEALEILGVPHIRLNMSNSYEALDVIKAMSPDIIFRQMPWEGATPPAYQTAELSFARLCYVPYSFRMPKRLLPTDDLKGRNHTPLHTDLYLHRMCWRIFCETEMHKAMFAVSNARGGEHVVVAGYTKFDRLLEGRAHPVWPVPDTGEGRKFRLIWAPHHSVTQDRLGFGTFHCIYEDMLAWAEADPGIEIVLRPHPILFAVLIGKKVMTKETLDGFLTRWNSLPNTCLYEEGDYGPLFAASDAMLTGGVSFFAEYQVFEKPLIFIDSGRHFGFNEAGELVISSANRVTTVAEARALCERLRRGEPDPMGAIQKRNLPRIMPYPGQSAQRILASIREGLEKERGEYAASTSVGAGKTARLA